MTPTDPSWPEACRAALAREIARLRACLEGSALPETETSAADHAVRQFQARFGLTDFESDLLILCAGAEVDGGFAELCAEKQKDPRATSPTFGLALAMLPAPHWSALSPCGALRFWRLLEVGAGTLLTAAPLRIDERILHYLLGVSYLDERLQPFLEIVRETRLPLPCEQAVATALARLWSESSDPLNAAPVQVTGRDRGTLRRVAAAAARASGHAVFALRLEDVPLGLAERHSLGTLWRRESLLNRLALLVDVEGAGESQRSALAWVEALGGRVALLSREPLASNGTSGVRFDVPAPCAAERLQQWREALGPAAADLNGDIDTLAASFALPPAGLREALAFSEDGAPTADHVWNVCRRQARLRLGDLARRIEPRATWEDLILPCAQKDLLRELCAHVRHRAHVYETWGFADRSARGLGLSALFSGASGTGKTTAAEVIASETRMDLYRVDLSGVVSKYIGETERNLRRVFDAAEASGAILLFDEADALFGKRSEVKDSHDRYANIEVSYLLQRMETYPGLAILTTNLKAILDPAFFRRLRFVVEFPFPDASMREDIWRGIFPRQTETRGLDFVKLARLNVAGGNIRNIALNAAFLASAERDAVQMKHLLAAARTEYRKIEKPLTEAETGGWA
jgi:ATPase family associated with various cellular activities (AAA)